MDMFVRYTVLVVEYGGVEGITCVLIGYYAL